MLFREWRENRKHKATLEKEQEEWRRTNEGYDTYNHLLRIVNKFVKDRTIKDQLLLLDYMIDSMLDDICTKAVAEPLFKYVSGPANPPFPNGFYDEHENRYDISSKETIPVDLSKEKIYVRPWNQEKTFINLIRQFSEEFRANNNHSADYYTDIKLCHVHNGNHSINAGRYFKKGVINAKKLDTVLLYPHIKTDGVYWINIHTGKKLFKVDDYRLACVYSLAQIRYKVRNTLQKI